MVAMSFGRQEMIAGLAGSKVGPQRHLRRAVLYVRFGTECRKIGYRLDERSDETAAGTERSVDGAKCLVPSERVIVHLRAERGLDLCRSARETDAVLGGESDPSRVRPCCCSQNSTLAKSASDTPKRAANCSGVSHLWYWDDLGSCCATSSACRSASCAAERLNTMLIPDNGVAEGRRPASNSARAIGGWVPRDYRALRVVSISSVGARRWRLGIHVSGKKEGCKRSGAQHAFPRDNSQIGIHSRPWGVECWVSTQDYITSQTIGLSQIALELRGQYLERIVGGQKEPSCL